MKDAMTRMKTATMRKSPFKLAAPAAFAITLLSLATTTQANQQDATEQHGGDRELRAERMEERMEERRQEAYQRAELSDAQQKALNEAHAEYRDAMQALRDDYQAAVAEILTEEEQRALREAVREIRTEQHGERGHARRGHHPSAPASE